MNPIVFQMNFINTIPEGVGGKELIQIIYEHRIWLFILSWAGFGHRMLQTNLKSFFFLGFQVSITGKAIMKLF